MGHLRQLVVGVAVALAALCVPALAQAPAIAHFPGPTAQDWTLNVVQGQDRLIVATSAKDYSVDVVTENFDGSDVRHLAHLAAPSVRTGFDVLAVYATASTWVLGWRIGHTFDDDQAGDSYRFVQAERVIVGTMDGKRTVVEKCTAKHDVGELGEEGVSSALSVSATADRVTYSGALCPGTGGRGGVWTRTPSGVRRVSARGSSPVLKGRYMAFLRTTHTTGTSLVIADAATGRVLRTALHGTSSLSAYDLASDGTIAFVVNTGKKSASLKVATPATAPRTVASSAYKSDVVVTTGRVLYTATDGHLVTMALPASGAAQPLAGDLPAGESPSVLLSLDANRAVYFDTTCAGSEVTVVPLAAAPVGPPADAACPVQFAATAQATASGRVQVSVTCPLGCTDLRVLMRKAPDSNSDTLGYTDVSLPAGATGTATIAVDAATKAALANGPLTVGLDAESYGRDGNLHDYVAPVTIQPPGHA